MSQRLFNNFLLFDLFWLLDKQYSQRQLVQDLLQKSHSKSSSSVNPLDNAAISVIVHASYVNATILITIRSDTLSFSNSRRYSKWGGP